MITDRIKIKLASGSPRRKQLVEEMGFSYSQEVRQVEEILPDDIDSDKAAEYLAELKSHAFEDSEIEDGELLLTADTVVAIGNKILGKPKSAQEAFDMIKSLSGKDHYVITGVCLRSNKKSISFSGFSKVTFRTLKDDEIRFYIDKFNPLDKAAAYGIQEWIGKIGVSKINGCFYNVMGLPTSLIWEKINEHP